MNALIAQRVSAERERHEAKLARLQEPGVQDAIAKAFGEVICSQLEFERVGEGDKQRAHFILRGKALDFSAATIAAIAVIKEILK
jgi:hypothetical protein